MVSVYFGVTGFALYVTVIVSFPLIVPDTTDCDGVYPETVGEVKLYEVPFTPLFDCEVAAVLPFAY